MNSATNGAGGAGSSNGSNGFGMFPGPLMSGVQRLGFDTSAEVIKGFIGLLGVERESHPAGPDVGPPVGQEPSFAQLRVNVARALDLYSELVRRSFEGYADLMERGLRMNGVRLNAEDDGTSLTLQGSADGVRAEGTVWIHNTTDQPASVVFRLTDLTAHDGEVVASGSGTFEPAGVIAAPDASVSARLEIALDGADPGIYHGHVMAGGLPDAALPVRLDITDAVPGPAV
ncbi:MAG: hypothetical protein H0V92_03075 [Pseudonocardiales bacterium]|nr:hypothetical protein [Pseudonocardiales bacterium]